MQYVKNFNLLLGFSVTTVLSVGVNQKTLSTVLSCDCIRYCSLKILTNTANT